jgi:ABC-type nitrate/sulfonate/bicarbonate transport system permease component
VSITDLTTRAGWIAGLAIVALVLAGWRKPARAQPRAPRSNAFWDETFAMRRPRIPYDVDEEHVPLYRRAGPIKRVWAALASSVLAVVTGAVLATVVAFATALLVTTLTDLLKK